MKIINFKENSGKSNYKYPYLYIKKTKKCGNGVFANEDIKKGRRIWVLSGERMDVIEWAKKVDSGSENMDDSLQIGKRTYIDLNEVSRTFNHSCDPNSGLRKKSELFAIRNIKKDEEVVYDYSTTVAPTVWEMKCGCGSKKCRNVIGNVLTIPTGDLEKYDKLGALQLYMKILLKSLKNNKQKFILPKYEIKALKSLRLINK